MVIAVPLTASLARAILNVRTWGGAANMAGKFIKYNVLTEARKVLMGEKTKVGRESLLHALADRFVAAHSSKRKSRV
jgi:hypothetical protein